MLWSMVLLSLTVTTPRPNEFPASTLGKGCRIRNQLPFVSRVIRKRLRLTQYKRSLSLGAIGEYRQDTCRTRLGASVFDEGQFVQAAG